MWDRIKDEEQDLQWLVSGLENGTIVCVTDGSYDRKIAPDISGAGLMLLYCTKAKRVLRGNFYEKSATTSSYRGDCWASWSSTPSSLPCVDSTISRQSHQ